MRLLSLRFQNLNSLVGEWSLDFTHPHFLYDGLFAIIGPTGAGKSTLLDAICLALYGRTPRLGKITQSNNALMSRQTGSCFAEVFFEVQDPESLKPRRYRSFWSQHRAHKKPDGTLQRIHFELSKACDGAETGHILCKELKEMEEAITALTGLDFDRFTRSILLAQGEFATFLQASTAERGPLLEQITGTALYGEISKAVYERSKAEKAKKEALIATQKGLNLLSAAEQQAYHANYAQLETEKATLTSQLKHLEACRFWHQEISKLEQEQADLQEKQNILAEAQKAFAPKKERLQQGLKALDLSATYSGLTSQRNQVTKDKHALASARATLPEQEKLLQAAQDHFKMAESAVTAEKKALEDLRPLVIQIRALDGHLKHKTEAAEKQKAELHDQKEKYEALQKEQNKDKEDLQQHDLEKNKIEAFLKKQAQDQALLQDLPLLEKQAEALQELSQRQKNDQQAHKAAQETAAKTKTALESAIKASESAQQEVERCFFAQKEAETTLSDLLQGQTRAALRQTEKDLHARQKALTALQTTLTQIQQHEKQCENLTEEGLGQKAELEQHQKTLAEQQNLVMTAGQHVEGLQKALAAQDQYRSFEEARAQLQDHEACPLCGALDHPYKDPKALPPPQDAQQDLDNAQQALKQAEEALKQGEIVKARQEERLQNLRTRLREEQGFLKDAETAFYQQRSEVAFSDGAPSLSAQNAPYESLAKTLAHKIEALTPALATLEAQNQNIDTQEEALKALGSTLENARALFSKTETQRQTTSTCFQDAHYDCQKWGEKSLETQNAVHRAEADFQAALKPYGVSDSVSATDSALYLTDLRQRRDDWLTQAKHLDSLTLTISAAKSACTERENRLSDQKTALDIGHSHLAAARADIKATQENRHALFGDQDPDLAEKAQEQLLAQAEHAQTQSRTGLAEAQKAVDRTQQTQKDLQNRLEPAEQSLQSLENAFQDQCQTLGFATEQDYCQAVLSPEDRETLEKTQQELQERHTALKHQDIDLTEKLTAERRKNLTNLSLPEIQEAETKQHQAQTELIAKQTEITLILEDHAENQKRFAHQQTAIDQQSQDCARWAQLDSLIGQADGQKFRVFAQSLTFDHVLTQANQQLAKLSDRYILARLPQQDIDEKNRNILDLRVYDRYQAGVWRTTKTLSGGESFLVSLALALGLSQMASRTIQIQSLFLDEGFGTLDEETLEVALTTLAELQKDGKLIGVISHVQPLKERISTQIAVTPLSGGMSMLSGPGCQNIG